MTASAVQNWISVQFKAAGQPTGGSGAGASCCLCVCWFVDGLPIGSDKSDSPP